jgi:pyridoxine/pyridoxamine 5'-phosphate oxidase
MVLATMGDRPHARTVLLKAHDPSGFTFYTNRTSRKGNDLAAESRCCAVFPWYALGRQVTVEGAARPLSMAESEPYYHSRAWRSQVGAWASRQSRVLPSRTTGCATSAPAKPGISSGCHPYFLGVPASSQTPARRTSRHTSFFGVGA